MAGSTRKLYKQKGTGNARAGSVRATQRVGSGAAHGPHPKSWKYKINKKVRKLAMTSALAAKFAQGNLMIVDTLEGVEPKTKHLAELAKKYSWAKGGALIIDGETPPEEIKLASRNLDYIDIQPHNGLSVYHMLKRKHLVLAKRTLDVLDRHVL